MVKNFTESRLSENNGRVHIVNKNKIKVKCSKSKHRVGKAPAIITDNTKKMLDLFEEHRFYLNSHKAPTTMINGKAVQLNRIVLGVGPERNVKHKNGDKMDCRLKNLEATLRGVSIRRIREKQMASLTPAQRKWLQGVSKNKIAEIKKQFNLV